MINLEKWTEEAIMTWKALKDSDDFAKIKNLNHIRDHRKLITALHKYEALMTGESFDKNLVKAFIKAKMAVDKHNK